MKQDNLLHERKTPLHAILVLSVVLWIGFASTAHEAVHEVSNPQTMDEAITAYLPLFTNLSYTEAETLFLVESSGQANCKTWEPVVKEYSWGPGQVLGSTSRIHGFNGNLEELLTWNVGAYYAMKHLSDQKARAIKFSKATYGKYDRYVVRRHMYMLYNGGSAKYKQKYLRGEWRKVYRNRNHVLKCERIYWYNYNKNKLRGIEYVHDPCS